MDDENIGGGSGNKSDDSFYDSDGDEQMVAASTQALLNPPFTPVRPAGTPARLPQSDRTLTLSGRRLNSAVCAEASQSMVDYISSSQSQMQSDEQQVGQSPVAPSVVPFPSFVPEHFQPASQLRSCQPPSVAQVDEKGGGGGGGDHDCYNCGQPGHISRDCAEPRRGGGDGGGGGSRGNDNACFNCGQPEHFSRECTQQRR